MTRRGGLLALLLLPLGILVPDHVQATDVRPFVDFEAGPAFPGYNNVRIPGDGGTTFSLTQDLKAPAVPYFRARAGVRIGRHEIFAFFGPLTIRPTGTVPYDVLFVDAVFPANTFLDATWTFDTYRLTYRYAVVDDETWQVAIGATALIRVASISLTGGGLHQVKDNVGVVPLLSFKVAWTFAGPWSILLDGDALAVPQGRAEDVFLGIRYRFGDAVSGRVGYRFLEGGGDNASVYNFALVNFLAFGFDVTL